PARLLPGREGAALHARRWPRGPGTLLLRSPTGGDDRAPQHLPGLRGRPDRRRALLDDVIHRGSTAVGAGSGRQAAAATPDSRPRVQAGPGLAGGPPPRRCPPRPEAG